MSVEIIHPLRQARSVDLRRTDAHPDHWYPIAWSRELKPGAMLARKYAGEPIALVRAKTGELFALEDRCAHRQVPLTHGVVQGCTVKCGYHGWAYNAEGHCIDVPYLGSKTLPNGVKAYPCREVDGLIFIFPGDPALADDRHQAEAYVGALAQSEQDPLEGLSLLLELHGESLVDPQRMDARRIGVQGWAEALRNPVVHDNITKNIASVRQEIARLLARGQAAGQIRAELDSEAVAQVLIALFQGLTLSATLRGDADLAGVGPVIRDMIRNTLFTPAARAAHPDLPAKGD